jgi:hypothetical protein
MLGCVTSYSVNVTCVAPPPNPCSPYIPGSTIPNMTAIPDFTFEYALWMLYQLGGTPQIVGDGWINTVDVCPIEHLNLNWQSICDLTGLESFINLKTLKCTHNQTYTCRLTEIPTSTMPYLELFHGYGNPIGQGGVDVTNNPALKELKLGGGWLGQQQQNTIAPAGWTDLVSLDLSNNTILEVLTIYYYYMTDLDISTNTGTLTSLSVGLGLTTLNLGLNVDLSTLTFGGGASNMVVQVGTAARVTQANTLLASGGGSGTWSIPPSTVFTI